MDDGTDTSTAGVQARRQAGGVAYRHHPQRGTEDPNGDVLVPLTGIRPIDVHDVGEILDRVNFGAVLVDEQGVITFLNQPYAEFLGIARDDAIGRHVTEVIENTRMHVVVETTCGVRRRRSRTCAAAWLVWSSWPLT